MPSNKGAAQIASERRLKAFDLRKRGYSYRAIGKALGVSEAQSHRDIQRVMRQLEKLELEAASQYRQMELERLNDLLKSVYSAALDGDISAVQTALKISESRRKLLGLDSPERSEVAIAAVTEIPSPLTALEYQALTNGNGSSAKNN